MANIKISQLGSLTAPASADALVIVDASEAAVEQTKQIAWSDLKTALTGESAQYTTTGSYYALMPTNGISANGIVMLGNTSTIVWFYVNAAPPGWKIYVAGDALLACSGGTAAYNVNGGNYAGTWSISGLSMAHTHTGPSHTHAAGTYTVDDSHYHVYGDSVGENNGLSKGQFATDTQGSATTAIDGASAAGGTGNTGAASTSTVSSSGAWRPLAFVGKLFQLDNA